MFQSISIFIFLPMSKYCEVLKSLKAAARLRFGAGLAGGRGGRLLPHALEFLAHPQAREPLS